MLYQQTTDQLLSSGCDTPQFSFKTVRWLFCLCWSYTGISIKTRCVHRQLKVPYIQFGFEFLGGTLRGNVKQK